MDRIEAARFSTLPEAELAASLLRRHAIGADVADRETANTLPHLQIGLGGLRVTVPDGEAARARQILRNAQDGAYSDESEENDEWMAEATPGKVGELDESEIQGVIGSVEGVGKKVIIAALAVCFVLPVAACFGLVLFGG